MSDENKDTITPSEIRAELTSVLKKFEAQVKSLHDKERLAKNDGAGDQSEGMAMSEDEVKPEVKKAEVSSTKPCPGCKGKGKEVSSRNGKTTYLCKGCDISYSSSKVAKGEKDPGKTPDDYSDKEIKAEGSGGDIKKGKSLNKSDSLAKMGMTHALRVAGVSQASAPAAKQKPVFENPVVQKPAARAAIRLPGMPPASGKGVPSVGELASKTLAAVGNRNAPSTGGRVLAFVKKPGADEHLAAQARGSDASNLKADKKAAGIGFLSNLISKFHGKGNDTWNELTAPGAGVKGRSLGRMASAAGVLARTEMEKAALAPNDPKRKSGLPSMAGAKSVASSPTAMPKMPGLQKPASFPGAPSSFKKAAMAPGKPAAPKMPGAAPAGGVPAIGAKTAGPKPPTMAPASKPPGMKTMGKTELAKPTAANEKKTQKGEMPGNPEGLMSSNHSRILIG